MTFQEFISAYDRPGAIILLEGKRAVREVDAPLLVKIGSLLAREMQHASFRSGNAPGADALFAAGVAAVSAQRMEVIVPYSGHRKASSAGYQVYSLDDIDVAEEPEVLYHSRQNKNAERYVDRYVAGNRDVGAIKASYIIRDTVKVVGTKVQSANAQSAKAQGASAQGAEGIAPASFGIFYDDLSDPGKGGTGHTMAVCREYGVPLIDQRVWMGWLQS